MSNIHKSENEMKDLGILREQILYALSQMDIKIQNINRNVLNVIQFLEDQTASSLTPEDPEESD